MARVTSSQRIHLLDEVRASMTRAKIDPDNKEWQGYITAFNAGMPPHGGLGLGVNRLLQGFLGLDDIPDSTQANDDAQGSDEENVRLSDDESAQSVIITDQGTRTSQEQGWPEKATIYRNRLSLPQGILCYEPGSSSSEASSLYYENTLPVQVQISQFNALKPGVVDRDILAYKEGGPTHGHLYTPRIPRGLEKDPKDGWPPAGCELTDDWVVKVLQLLPISPRKNKWLSTYDTDGHVKSDGPNMGDVPIAWFN
ncbi:hypothetical protein PENSTE_c011G09312 [Penicillium steckii]|uniref:Aminoacyl-tRNA synthetase class II (D/K/N) domain-containing protein n=1 Tax=Penicillium steckii TaxID=303698 RepID=A0A1V6T5W0_9EURO|nr:hypothetical protein PENSTE_c011G09312 [Penicillium steckii]